jgi:diguanylate cyclase (GGDEF)-like protein
VAHGRVNEVNSDTDMTRIRLLFRRLQRSGLLITGAGGGIAGALLAAALVPVAVPLIRSMWLVTIVVVLAAAVAALSVLVFRVRRLALHDSLTALANRARLHEEIHSAMSRARRKSGQFVLVSVDIDHFKQINDQLGHAAGDVVLCEVARRLQQSVRPGDLVGRLGGDEFLILSADIRTKAAAKRLRRRIQTSMDSPITIGKATRSVTLSVGLRWCSGFMNEERLLQEVDRSMYRAKKAKTPHRASGAFATSVGLADRESA